MNETPSDSRSTPSEPRSSSEESASTAGPTDETVPTEREPEAGVYLQIAESYSGPLPHPAILERFRAVDPTFPGRVFDIAEREQAHRHEPERRRLEAAVADASADRRERRVGQFLGFAIMLAGLAVIVYAVWQREPWVAAAVGGVYVLGLVFLGSDAVRGRLARRSASENHP